MVRLINRTTGGTMYVHEARLDEYLAAGHQLPALQTASAQPDDGRDDNAAGNAGGSSGRTGRKRKSATK